MKSTFFVLMIISLCYCSEKRNEFNSDIRKADSLYWSFYKDKKIKNLIEADSILRIAANDSRANECYVRLSKISFVLGDNYKALNYLNNVDDSFFKDDYRKKTYIIALSAFSKYSEKDTNEAKHLLYEAISLIDNHITDYPDDSLAVSLKYILKKQVFDIDIDSLNHEIDQLPFVYLIYDIKNSYPAKMHYRFYNSSEKDFPSFLLKELDK